tara:strand:+ start:4525 stop:5304 length:780 start_codon:yes stop_codon:yes gene_type:complete
MADFDYVDKLFQINVTGTGYKSIADVLNINQSSNGHINDFSNGSTVIINSDRLLFNAKKDHLIISGREGVTLTSPKSIHIDSDDDIYLFSDQGEIYLGLPNRGREYNFKNQKVPKTKGDPTINSPYEPIVLGLKLANLLEDFIVLMRDAVIRTPTGDGRMSTEMMYNLENLHSRIPEMLSTTVFVDGVSHDKADAAPPVPEDVAITTKRDELLGRSGNTIASADATSTGTNLNNTQGVATVSDYKNNASNNPDGIITNN